MFWTPVTVTPGQTYFLVFASAVEDSAFGVAGDVNDPYPEGQVYANAGFGSFPEYDYAFRTYADDQRQQVPEPASLALLGIAFAGLAASRRRKR